MGGFANPPLSRFDLFRPGRQSIMKSIAPGDGPCGFTFARLPAMFPGMRDLVGCLLIPTTLMGFYPSQYCSRHPAPDSFPSDLTHLPLDLYSPRLIFVEGSIAVS